MNVLAAVIAGLVGTIVFSMVLAMAPMMGLPKMDIVALLGTMFGKANQMLGWMMHLMMGVIFALIYALLWSKGIGSATWYYGLAFGAVHWLIVGVIMAMIPMMHAGIRSGAVKAPGMYMTANGGGMMAFIGGLVGHMIYGLIVACAYAFILRFL